jgi:hypothetical protein
MRTPIGLLALVAGCGGGGGSALEGMYLIDAWNENQTSCADPGPSVLGDPLHGETVFYVKTENFLGEFLNARACVDLAECQMLAADDETIHLGTFGTFEEGSDGDGWSTLFFFGTTDPANTTQCIGFGSRDTLTADGENGVVLRLESLETPPFPMSGGDCADEDAEALAGSATCVSLEVVHGTQIGDL